MRVWYNHFEKQLCKKNYMYESWYSVKVEICNTMTKKNFNSIF